MIAIQPGNVLPQKAKPLLYGIEEEQIPIRTIEIPEGNVVERAYKASLASKLAVGIAFSGDRYVVHYKNLVAETPLFDEQLTEIEKVRNLGANAARLVKGIPFKNLNSDRWQKRCP